MAIKHSKKLSDLEKRLRLLRQQVYGKGENKKSSVYGRPPKGRSTAAVFPSRGQRKSEVKTSDIAYLRYDLVKILTLSALAIGAQLILFFLTRNHILNLNFF